MFLHWIDRMLGRSYAAPTSDLMQFGSNVLSFDQCFSGVALLGGTGSGKTSFLELILRALAEHPSQPGMLVCCAKIDEATRVEKIARRAGRSRDFIRLAADGSHHIDLFGYLQHSLHQSADGIARFCDRMAGLAVANSGSGADKTWQTQAVLMLTHGLTLFDAAGAKPSPLALFDVLVSCPKDHATAASDNFLRNTLCGQMIVQGETRYKNGALSPAQRAAFERAVNYFLTYAPGLGDRFLGSVVGSAATGLSPFLQPPFLDFFGGTSTTLPPDALLDGKIIALDFPAIHGPNAFVAQAAYVQLAQMLLLASPRGQRRPVVLCRDECQWLVSPEWDSRVQTICRSHGLITLSACQGIPVLVDAFGGDDAARVRAQAFLSNHMTQLVFATGSDTESREHFLKLFGESKQLLFNGGQQPNPNPSLTDRVLGCDFVPTVGWSQSLLPNVPPELFGNLKRGGIDHDYRVQAYLYQAGRRFSSGHPFVRIEFEQDLSP